MFFKIIFITVFLSFLNNAASSKDHRMLLRCEIPNANEHLVEELVPGVNDTSDCQWVIFYRANLLSVPKKVFELFPKTEVLKFSRASIQFVHNGTFEKAVNLKQLDLSNNELQVLGDYAFYGASNLTSLDLSMNRISTLKDNVFAGLNNLRFLNLGLNALTTLSVGTFKIIPSLVIIRAHLNKINHIDANTFENLPNLKVIDLALNKLESLELKLNHTDICKVSLSHNLLKSFEMTCTEHKESYYGKCGLGLILVKNQLTSINIDPYFHVDELFLSVNNITNIHDMKLNESTVEHLVLEENQIQLKVGDLDKYTKLQKLVLSNNLIDRINNGSFQNLGQLEELDLSKNPIKVLDFSNFSGLIDLDTLVMDDTDVVRLRYTNLKETVPKLDTIRLTKTHWSCNFLNKTIETLKGLGIRLKKLSTVITDPEDYFTIAGILCIPDELKRYSNETVRIGNGTDLDDSEEDEDFLEYDDIDYMKNLMVQEPIKSGHKISIILGTLLILTLACVVLYLFMSNKLNRGRLPGFDRFNEEQNSSSNLI